VQFGFPLMGSRFSRLFVSYGAEKVSYGGTGLVSTINCDIMICYKEFPHTDVADRAEDVLNLVPNLNWAGGTSRPRFFQLRGIGELEQWQGAPNPSIGFLIDGIDFSGVGMPASNRDWARWPLQLPISITHCSSSTSMLASIGRSPWPCRTALADASLISTASPARQRAVTSR